MADAPEALVDDPDGDGMDPTPPPLELVMSAAQIRAQAAEDDSDDDDDDDDDDEDEDEVVADAVAAPAAGASPGEASKTMYSDLLAAGSITQDTFDEIMMRIEPNIEMLTGGVVTEAEFASMMTQVDKQYQDVIADLVKSKAMGKAIEVFNTKGAKKGVIYFQENWAEFQKGEPTPEAIAKILKSKCGKGGLKKAEIGELLGGGKPINIAVRYAYAGLFDFTGITFVTCLRTFLAGFKLPGESMLIERIMADFAGRYYVCNPQFANHLTAEKIAELKATFDGFDGINGDGQCPALELCRLVKSMPGDYKYMKDDDIINDMVHITVEEVKFVAGMLNATVDLAAVVPIIPLIETCCSAAGALAVSDKAQSRAEEYEADVVKMKERIDAMEPGEEQDKELSRLENSKKQAAEKVAIAAKEKATAEEMSIASKAASATAIVSWPLFVTMMAHKMGNDTAFVLGYSTIQLNTDAHNPKLDDATRMTKKMFIANNRRSPDLACLADSFVSELYDEIANAEIKILDEDDLAAMDGGETVAAKKKKKKKEANPSTPKSSPKAAPSKTVSAAAFTQLAEFGIKRYSVQQRGLKKAPKKVTVLVTGMGLTLLDESGKPVTNLLYQMLGEWTALRDGLEIKRKNDKPVFLKTTEVAELKSEMDKAKIALTAGAAGAQPAAAAAGAKPTLPRTITATADYAPSFTGAIPMKVGDTVIIQKMDDPDWYFCQIGDKKGFVPAAFLE